MVEDPKPKKNSNPDDAPTPPVSASARTVDIEVRGPEGGRWRAGHYFTPDPTTLKDLNEAQLKAIMDDPLLRVKPL